MSQTIKQAINGILLLNKPQGYTSNAVLQKVKRMFGAKKAGHTGSLDPLATGMLPICFGEATKFSQYLLDADKAYETTACLGIKTTTADAQGEVIATCDANIVSQSQLEEVLPQFTGSIQQVPSMFSALKHQGQPLYKYARAGIDIERNARDVVIRSLVLAGFKPGEFQLEVLCSKGTYIRNLVEDIGETLGVGAHVTRLHRIFTAGFEGEVMYSIEELEQLSSDERLQCLLPVDRAIASLPQLTLEREKIRTIRQGQVLTCMSTLQQPGLIRIYDDEKNFIGLGDLGFGELKAKRLIAH